MFGFALASAAVLAGPACSSSSTDGATASSHDGGPTTGGSAGASAGTGGSTGGAKASGGASTGGAGGGVSTGGAKSPADAAADGTSSKCPAGFGDCDNNPADCETSLNLPTSCGSCTTVCDASHATVSCENEKCTIASCATGFGDCDSNGVTGCETSLTADTHCGDCARDCTTVKSTCSNGACGAVTVLATGGSGYQSAFVAGDSLYVMNTGSMPPGNYTTTRVPLDGSAASILTNNEAGGPGLGVLNADSSFIYWAFGNPASVVKKSVTAKAADLNTLIFHPAGSVRYMKIVNNSFYWMTDSPTWTLYKRSMTAPSSDVGTQIVTADQSYVSAFRATTDRIYWIHRPASTPSLVYVPLAGGTPTPVPDAVVADGAPLWSVGNTLYFVRNSGGTAPENGVYKYATGDTTVTELVQATGVSGILADANALYYGVGFDGFLYKSPLTPQNGVPIASGFSGVLAGDDAKFIYSYSAWGSDGPVKKMLK